MSEIQRYRYAILDESTMLPYDQGRYCLYTDLAWERRQKNLAVCALVVVVCTLFSAYLVTGKYAPQPVKQASADTASPWQALSDKLDSMIETHHQAVAIYDTAWKDRERRDREWAKRVAHLEAQVKAQNALLNTAQQTEVLKLASKPMHDGELFKLAKEFGFAKVRVVE